MTKPHRYLSGAVREPRMALRFALAILKADSQARHVIREEYVLKECKRYVARLFQRESRKSLDELWQCISDSGFHSSMRRALSSDEYACSGLQGRPIFGAELLYVACRVLRPRVVVETGVGPGVSTSYILKALDDNGFGLLHSIDMPTREHQLLQPTPEQRTSASSSCGHVPLNPRPSGWLVPESLRWRWKLYAGLSQEVLPEVLRECGELDIFLHDSEHTYENMLFEYRSAWPRLREGGVLVSHDIESNTAFADFAHEVLHEPIVMMGFGGFGAIFKRQPDSPHKLMASRGFLFEDRPPFVQPTSTA